MTRLELITGFLGAGKTTFLARYAAWLEGQGLRTAIIENEFGQAGVDGAILASSQSQVRELSGGCICCGLKVGFHDLLCQLAQSGQVDRILIEPSGIFNLDDYFDVINSPDVAALAQPGAVITVVDPDCLEQDDPLTQEMLFSQLHSASVILISKLDREAGPRMTEKIDSLFATFGAARAPSQAVVALPWEELDREFFLSLGRAAPVLRPHERKTYVHGTLFFSTRLPLAHALGQQELEQKLRRAFLPEYGRVLRIKGYARLTGGQAVLVNCTARSISLEPDPGQHPAQLNIIGQALDRRRLSLLYN